MKALAVGVLFACFACLASAGGYVAELAKAGVEAGRSGALATLDATQSIVHDTGHNIVHDITNSNKLIHSAVKVCRKAVYGGFECCCAAADRVYKFADDGVLRCRATVARCTHAACTAIDGVLDGPAAAVAQLVVEAGGLVADKGLDLAAAGNEAAIGLGVGGLEIAEWIADLPLKGVDVATDVGLITALFGVGVGTVGANVACGAGRALVNTVADGNIYLINALDNALGERPQRRVEGGGHAHQE